MKKTKIIIIIPVLVTLLAISCQDMLEEFYPDPQKSPNTKIEWMFTYLVTNENPSFRPTYWYVFTQYFSTLATLTHTTGSSSNSRSRYEQQDLYIGDRWTKLYYRPTLSTYREMQILYRNVPESQKNGYALFMELAKVFTIYETQKITDLFGDIPFSEAGLLRDPNNQVIFPKFDTQEEIYTWCIDELKATANYLDSYDQNANQYWINLLKKQDLLLNGNIDNWKRFVNSLRLRFAIRISEVNPTKAASIITEVLDNPAKYPIIETNAQNTALKAQAPDLLTITNRHGEGILGAFRYFHYSNNWANGLMYSKMSKIDGTDTIPIDPRVEPLFTKASDGNYRGYDWSWSPAVEEAMISAEMISRMDSATFMFNDYIPSSLITASEVSFIKAEAYNRGLATGNAQAEYENGIRLSILYYYGIRNGNVNQTPLTMPSETVIAAFLAEPKIAYEPGTPGLEKIMAQKWIHLGFLQAEEAYAELRRSKLPQLPADEDETSPKFKFRSNRWVYPSSEIAKNPNNYAPYRATDLPTTKVWWDTKSGDF